MEKEQKLEDQDKNYPSRQTLKVADTAGEFISQISWSNGNADTLVIHCSDHRFQDHFNAFIQSVLHSKPDVLAIPGGPQVLIAASYIEKFEWAGRRWVKYLRDKHELRRIICISHEDCGWYKNITVGNIRIPALRDRQLSDLNKIYETLKDMFPKVETETWYATRVDEQVKFIKTN